MATRSGASSQLKKKSGPLQQKSTNSDTVSSSQSTGVVTRSMAKAAAATNTKRTVACASLHSTDGTDSNMNDGVGKSLPVDPLKGKSTSTLKMKQQAPFFEVEDYYSSDSSASPSKKVVLPQSEAESSQTGIMPAMMIGVVDFDEEFANMKAMLEMLSKESAEKDAHIKRQEEQIAKLLKKLDKGPRASSNRGASSDEDKKESYQSEASEDDDGSKKGGKPQNDSSLSAMTAEQIQELIANAVKTQLGVGSQRSHLYTKPYTKRIDALRMPYGYQPPKFNQFDGRGNPKQHVAHFIETCNNAGTGGDLLVKQFVRTLKSIAFDWYTDLLPESIDSWGQMEQEFLNRFYCTRRVVSLAELTSTKQRKEESVLDYINRWRSLNLECKDRLSEASAVDMCAQGMEWDILYALQVNKPKTFQELATRAHDMEVTIAYYGKQLNDDGSITSSRNKSSMRRCSEENKYPCSELDVQKMFHKLLEKGLIELPESKRPEEVGRTDDPKYCEYHRIIGHPLEKCDAFRGQVLQLVKEENHIRRRRN